MKSMAYRVNPREIRQNLGRIGEVGLDAIRFFYLQVLTQKRFDVTLHVPKRAQRIPELLCDI